MKNIARFNVYLFVIIGIGLLSFSGCSEDFFDKEAGDRITPDQHYKSMIDLEASSQGAIIALQDFMPKLIILDGLRSDMMDVTQYSDVNLKNINEQIFDSSNPYLDASGLYKVVVNVNEVLSYLDSIAANDVNFDDHFLHYATGELIAMRSWAYFTITRLYNESAYIEDNLTSLPKNLEQTILSKSDMIDTLINQMTPYIYDPLAGQERVEIKLSHYVNPKALLGELYLEKGDYEQAIVYLKMACESYFNQASLYKVDKTYKDDGWKSIFLNAETAGIENISVIPFSSIEGQNNPLANWLGHEYDYYVQPSQVIVDAFMSQVPAAGPVGDPYRGRGVTFEIDTVSKQSETEFVTEAYITKYAVDRNDPASSDIIISRASDLHLLLAEAYNLKGDLASQEYAMMFLNQGVNKTNPKPVEYNKWKSNVGIRGRVYLKPLEVPRELFGNNRTLYIEDLILQERALELAYEGKRWFDLVRFAERRNDPAYLADKVAAKFAGTSKYNDIRAHLMIKENWYLTAE
jgi:tetratricopeptide (TPR) repeat protein